jgi:serine/threonine protein kinase/class 3 adenylate cyclase
MIHFSCVCGLKLKVKDEHAGRSSRCPTCKRPITVPPPNAANDATGVGEAPALVAPPIVSETQARGKTAQRVVKHPAELPRGIVTIMFTDIVGSTRLKNLMAGDTSARRDAGFRAEIKEPHDAVVFGQVELSEGHLVNSTGDGYCFAFLDVEEAVLCALRIQGDLLTHKPVPTPDGPLRIRIGLHTGMADPAKDGYTASTLDKAARVQSRADAGTVLLSREAHALVMGKIKSVSFVRAGAFQLKGLEPEELFRAEIAVAAPPGRTKANSPAPLEMPAHQNGLLAPPRAPDELGWLAHYRVLKVLGQGGMGVVYHAEDSHLQRAVAVKAVLPELARDEATRQRFLREARATAAIKSDHIVMIHQVGMENVTPYLVMEFLQGESLSEWLDHGGAATVKDIVRIGREIALGLSAAHQRGLIHRDIKPSNIWLEAPHGRVKLLDFGLARPVADNQHITQSGMVLGTPTHMAPEQARGEPTDARADLFSLGCVLYRLCTGKVPFAGNDSISTLVAVATENPPSPQEINATVPVPLSNLVMQLLSKKAERRPPSAQAVCDALDEIAEKLPQARLAAVATPSRARNHEAPADEDEDESDSDGTMLGEMDEDDADSDDGSRVRTMRKSGSRSRQRRRLPVMMIAAAALGVALTIAISVAVIVTLTSDRRRPQLGQEPPGKSQLPPHGPNDAPVEVTWPAAGETGDYLKSLVPIERQTWHLIPPTPPDAGPPPDKVDDFPVRVRNKRWTHSLFMHPAPGPPGPGGPPGSAVRVTYRLGKKYRVFHALVSLNDGPPRSDAPMTFKVIGDGRTLWTSEPVQSQAETQRTDVDVKGIDSLTLEVTTPGEPRGCHAAWIEPYAAK